MKTNRLTIVERPDNKYHRSPIILREIYDYFIFAEFENVTQLNFFAQTVGFTYTLESCKDTECCGTWKEYKTSHRIETADDRGFWSLEDLPEGAKPIKALSNGSIVTCYYTNDGERIMFYRPNPNARNVYNPLPTNDHIAHRNIYGVY